MSHSDLCSLICPPAAEFSPTGVHVTSCPDGSQHTDHLTMANRSLLTLTLYRCMSPCLCAAVHCGVFRLRTGKRKHLDLFLKYKFMSRMKVKLLNPTLRDGHLMQEYTNLKSLGPCSGSYCCLTVSGKQTGCVSIHGQHPHECAFVGCVCHCPAPSAVPIWRHRSILPSQGCSWIQCTKSKLNRQTRTVVFVFYLTEGFVFLEVNVLNL